MRRFLNINGDGSTEIVELPDETEEEIAAYWEKNWHWEYVRYKDDRRAEYPPIGEQLDALYHAGLFPEEMAAKIKAVKDKYPKRELPEQ